MVSILHSELGASCVVDLPHGLRLMMFGRWCLVYVHGVILSDSIALGCESYYEYNNKSVMILILSV